MYNSQYIGSFGLNTNGFIEFSKQIVKTRDNFLITNDCINKEILQSILEEVLDNLQNKLKKIFLLLYYENLNVKETCLVLNVSEYYVLKEHEIIANIAQKIINERVTA